MSNKEIDDDIQPWCPRWSQILGEKTNCLGLECTRFIPIRDSEIRKEVGVSGFCMDNLNTVNLEDLAASLSAIVGIMESPAEVYNEEILEQSKKQEVHGYE